MTQRKGYVFAVALREWLNDFDGAHYMRQFPVSVNVFKWDISNGV